ncbi:MAG: OmpH family outer membrane protein [Gemmataceae bacterium]|nr:OmpH family outer membrane protein [Gemmataceae bacterium]
MKTIILSLAALVAFGFAGRAHAQQPAPTHTRVAVVNVGLVFSKYEKAMAFKTEMEKLLDPFKKQEDAIKADMKKYGEALEKYGKTVDEKTRDSYQQYLLSLKHKLEGLTMEARTKVGKRQEDQIVTLYKELSDATARYAQANGFHLVLGYGEQVDSKDLFSIMNINRKMNGMDLGSTNPLFFVGGVDISTGIADTLNAAFRGAGGVVPTSGVSGKN